MGAHAARVRDTHLHEVPPETLPPRGVSHGDLEQFHFTGTVRRHSRRADDFPIPNRNKHRPTHGNHGAVWIGQLDFIGRFVQRVFVEPRTIEAVKRLGMCWTKRDNLDRRHV